MKLPFAALCLLPLTLGLSACSAGASVSSIQVGDLLDLQGMLFLLILLGVFLRKRGIIDDAGKRCLTDVTINLIIPCNIVRSFMIDFSLSVLQSCWMLLAVSTAIQLSYFAFNRVLYNRWDGPQKKLMQYATICTNSAFLGNPISEGLYGSLGLLYNSVFLIPMRIVMWSIGVSYFSVDGEKQSKKEILKKVFTHPCLMAVYIGVFFMVTQLHLYLPRMVTSAIQSVGGCNTAMTMLIIGTILADVNVLTIFNPTTLYFAVVRLGLFPLLVLLVCRLIRLDNVATGVAVLMTGMPAGSTTAIFAAKYNSDAPFAVKLVVSSTLISMVTIPIWRLIVG